MAATLPSGKHDLQLYSVGTPNGLKISIMLEELGVPYDAWRIDIRKGEQFGEAFTAKQPNNKIPLLVDNSADGHAVFESGAILEYLGLKYTSPLFPSDPVSRSNVTQWLMFQMGSAPYLGGGGFGHYTKYAPEKIEYAIERTTKEARRILEVIDSQLGRTSAYLAGDEYSIADIAMYPWMVTMQRFYDGEKLLGMGDLQHLNAWMKRVEVRPAVQRGMQVLSFANEDKHYSTDGTV